MSLIGMLEQFGLANVLQRSERYEKTGLLTLKQGPNWIEFYLNAGRLLCVGPLRTSANLGERLLQEGLISPTFLQEMLRVVKADTATESFMARTLIELDYVSRDELRNWTIKNTVNVLKVVLTWTTGEIYFDENTPAPTDRLLVSMSISDLLAQAATVPVSPPKPPTPQVAPPVNLSQSSPMPRPASTMPPVRPSPPTQSVPVAEPRVSSTLSPDVARVPTLMSASQFLDDSSFRFPAPAVPDAEPVMPPVADVAPNSGMLSAADLMVSTDSPFATLVEKETGPARLDSGFLSLFAAADGESSNNDLHLPVPVAQPMPPKRIDTSFMRPEMVLLPADLTGYRQQNPQVQLTPDQWCLLTYVDGQTPLTNICQMLNAAPEIVCQVAGELIAEGLIYPSMPDAAQASDSSPVARELVASGLGNGYVAPGYVSATASPWSASMPAVPLSANAGPQQPGGKPVETESQWGNGGNGATFIPGRGWITTPQPLQPLQTTPQGGEYVAPMNGNGMY